MRKYILLSVALFSLSKGLTAQSSQPSNKQDSKVSLHPELSNWCSILEALSFTGIESLFDSENMGQDTVYEHTAFQDLETCQLAISFLLTAHDTKLMCINNLKKPDIENTVVLDYVASLYHESNIDYVNSILDFREGASAIHNGKTIFFVPQFDVHTYLRKNNDQMVWVILNNSDEPRTININDYFDSRTRNRFESGYEVISEQTFQFEEQLDIRPKTAMIIDLHLY